MPTTKMTDAPLLERTFSPGEVALRLGCSTKTVKRWLRQGKLPGAYLLARRLGWRIPASAVRDFIARQQEWAAAGAPR